MKKKITFNPAWIMLLLVVATLLTMNFMDDEHLRNVIAGAVLAGCFVLFVISVLVRTFSSRIAK
jgi:uncharacterized membrane protein YdjX (TVP38/TMEM64 family)